MIGAFQLYQGSNYQLPFILIREEPGIHLIGLDAVGYLNVPTATLSTNSDEQAKIGEPYSQIRENNVLKMRSLQSLKNDPYE
jgi:hypothetical protein